MSRTEGSPSSVEAFELRSPVDRRCHSSGERSSGGTWRGLAISTKIICTRRRSPPTRLLFFGAHMSLLQSPRRIVLPTAAVLACLLINTLPPQDAAAQNANGEQAAGLLDVEVDPVLLKMIRDSAVQSELELSETQSKQVQALLRDADGIWFRSRITPTKNRRQAIATVTGNLQSKLGSVLSKAQMERLDQLQNQALGTRMFLRPECAAALNVTENQRSQMIALYQKSDTAVADAQKKLRAGEWDQKEAAKTIAQAKLDEREAIGDLLTDTQKQRFAAVTGKTFDFSKVVRSLPLAPEIKTEGSQWLQSLPETSRKQLNLAQLEGKVVALHFYAFQCINCRRNLPHYNAWHEDYADKGLVVIGIQRPETSAERSPEKVLKAARSEQIKYPVLMDSQSSNWDAWGNTMWPTVYLIDKQGYLRRWWQGEMNWQGTEGEKDMRKTIEQLLAEDA